MRKVATEWVSTVGVSAGVGLVFVLFLVYVVPAIVR
jgi:hypothetical protein